MSDTEFREAFEDCSLPEADFDHEAHIRMGWIYVRSYPLAEAIDRFCSNLKAYTQHLGAPDKYHETITWFYLMLINERVATLADGHVWADFRSANADLFESGGMLLRRYYGEETLATAQSRIIPLLPTPSR